MAFGFKAVAALGLIAAGPAFAQSAGSVDRSSAPASVSIEQPAMIGSTPSVMTAFTGTTVMTEARSGGASATAAGSGGAAVVNSITRSGFTAVPTPTTFVVAGDGGQSISVTVPPSVDMTRQGGTETAQLTTTNDLAKQGQQVLRGEFDGAGALSFNVGGQVTLATNMASGTYNGILAVVAQYN